MMNIMKSLGPVESKATNKHNNNNNNNNNNNDDITKPLDRPM